jgi:hypothetical protein
MGAQEPTATSQPLDSISTLDSKSIDNGCLHLDRLGSPILSVSTSRRPSGRSHRCWAYRFGVPWGPPMFPRKWGIRCAGRAEIEDVKAFASVGSSGGPPAGRRNVRKRPPPDVSRCRSPERTRASDAGCGSGCQFGWTGEPVGRGVLRTAARTRHATRRTERKQQIDPFDQMARHGHLGYRPASPAVWSDVPRSHAFTVEGDRTLFSPYTCVAGDVPIVLQTSVYGDDEPVASAAEALNPVHVERLALSQGGDR